MPHCGLATTGARCRTLAPLALCGIEFLGQFRSLSHALGNHSVARTKNFLIPARPDSHQVQPASMALRVPAPQMRLPATCAS